MCLVQVYLFEGEFRNKQAFSKSQRISPVPWNSKSALLKKLGDWYDRKIKSKCILKVISVFILFFLKYRVVLSHKNDQPIFNISNTTLILSCNKFPYPFFRYGSIWLNVINTKLITKHNLYTKEGLSCCEENFGHSYIP